MAEALAAGGALGHAGTPQLTRHIARKLSVHCGTTVDADSLLERAFSEDIAALFSHDARMLRRERSDSFVASTQSTKAQEISGDGASMISNEFRQSIADIKELERDMSEHGAFANRK